MQQAVYCHAEVHRPTVPTCDGRPSVNDDVVLLVPLWQLAPVAHRMAVPGCDAVYAFAVRLQETNRAIIQYVNLNLTFMNRAVMEAA